jgi:Cu/Ag efflux pump CusA
VVDPVSLEKRGLKLGRLIEVLEANNANAGAGTLDQSGQSYLIRSET